MGVITATELLALLRLVEARGAVTVARMVRSTCSSVFRYAVITGRADRDPAGDLRGAICRPVEIVHAEWREFDVQDNLWRIPAHKMEMVRDHLVPLSPQAVAVLEAIRPYSGAGE